MKKIKFIIKSIIDLFLLLAYKLLFIITRKKKIDVWLISERGYDARDNGYALYVYMIQNHPEINVKYVISKDSIDRKKIREEDIVSYRTKEHYYYFLYSKILISAQIMGFSPNEQLYYRLNKYHLLRSIGKTVFLQHGITMGFNSYLLSNNTNLDLFICGAIPEYDFVIDKLGYSKDIAKLTGFARFDNLKPKKEKVILIMPTWRKWLKYNKSITSSNYYEMYKKILMDEKIKNKLIEKKYKIIFYPHIVFQKFIDEFKQLETQNVIVADFNDFDIQDLIKKSDVLVTDYSSVQFDFSYMKKKIIYYQFDENEYYSNHCSKGYFNYDEDGFGPVCRTEVELKEEIIKYLINNKSLNSYENRIEKFFNSRDYKNSERIYNEILKL